MPKSEDAQSQNQASTGAQEPIGNPGRPATTGELIADLYRRLEAIEQHAALTGFVKTTEGD